MSEPDQHIENLIRACKKGKQSAQLEIYNRYCKAMYNTAYRIVKDSSRAEDVMQDSFLTAFTRLDDLRDSAMFGAWLKKIVIHNSLDQYKTKKRQNEIPLDRVLYKVEDEKILTSEDRDTHLQVKQVLKAMNGLKNNYQLVLTLYFIEGYDHEEISSIMQISHGNCRTMISRAKKSLRKKIDSSEG